MSRRLACLMMLFVLLGLSGCASEETVVPELLEPAGVRVDMAEVKLDDIYTIATYTGEMVPYVEEIPFQKDGIVDEVKVTLGDVVEKGQVLATLSDEETVSQIEDTEEQIAEIIALGEYSDRQKRADIEIAEIELNMLLEGGASKQDCRLKEVDLQKLELALEQAQELRQLELQELQEKLTKLRGKLNNNQITAPFDGRIVYSKQLKKGNSVEENQTVFCIADDSRLTLQADYMSESLIEKSDEYYVVIEGKEYAITYIPYETSEYLAMVLYGNEMKSVFTVEAEEGELESGQFAVVSVINGCKEDVLTIPVNALHQDENGNYVYKIVDDQRIRCDVTVGVANNIKVEILEGLKEGDMVYVME